MRKLKYNTRAVKQVLSILEISVDDKCVSKNAEDITVTAEDTETITKTVNRLETDTYLAYQIEDQGRTLVIFDPRV